MRGQNGTDSLMVCLSEYQILRSVYILVIKVCFAKRPRTAMVVFQNTCCPQCERPTNNEIDQNVYPP